MNPRVYFNLTVQMLQRSNPFADIMARLQELAQTLMTYNSNVKLNKFRHNLYVQQLRRMEGYLSQGSPYTYRGEKMDRRF